MRIQAALCLLLAATSLSAQTGSKPADIISAEELFWTNYTTGNTKALADQLGPDFINVEQKIWTRDQVLSFVKLFTSKCTLAPVKLVDPRVTYITPEVATIVYQATEAPTCNGGTTSGDVNVSTVWINRAGRWQMQLHTEYALRPGGRY